MAPNSLEAVLELCRTATPETVGAVMKQVHPAVVELALTEVELNQVFGALKEATGATLGALRRDFSAYLKANGLTAEQESVGTKLVRLALDSGLELWRDPEGHPWATLRTGDHTEHHPLKTKAVRRYLTHLYYAETESAPHAQGLQDALGTLEAKAVFEGAEHPTYVRVAEHDGTVYLDLANEDWQVVRITPAGWAVIRGEDAPVRFRRPRGMLTLPTPVQGGQLTELAALLNVETGSRDWQLIVAWLLQALRGVGPYPVLVLTGGQGSGKSTAAKMLRALVDPNVSPLRSLSRDERDLFIAAMNGWTLAFDNISGLSQWISDALCKLSTGGGLSARELYSDDAETLLDATRPTILNGITDFVDKQDLVDRALQVRLPSIPATERRPEKELWERFSAAQPRILGALLDTVAAGLARLPSTHLDSLPRLADFALWATACEAPLGWQPGAFMAAYADAHDDLIRDALEAEPVAVALLKFTDAADAENEPGLPNIVWKGTATELLDVLTSATYGDKRPPKGWPAAPRVLSQTLKRIAPALLAQGLEVTQERSADRGRSRFWQIRQSREILRPVRPQRPHNAEKSVQDGTNGVDASADARRVADASLRPTDDLASNAERRAARKSDAPDAPDAKKPILSNSAKKQTSSHTWDGLDL